MISEQSVWSLLGKIWGYLSPRRHRQFFLIIFLTVITALFEIVSLGAVIPFISAITAPEKLLEYDVVEFEPNDNMLLYATYNQAFKSGVINTGSTSPALEPETVDAFEVGVKVKLNSCIHPRLNNAVHPYNAPQQ